MTITERHIAFHKRYKKVIKESTYEYYHNIGWTDKRIATTDLRNGLLINKNTITAKYKAFIKRTGVDIQYNAYFLKQRKGIKEDDMVFDRRFARNKKKPIKKEEKVRVSKFKPIIKQTLKECDDEYYLT